MAQYTHPDLPDFISPSPFRLGEGDDAISYARGWWDKATSQKIKSLGFVEYVAPPAQVSVAAAILSAPSQGFGGPTGKELFNGNR